jgi:membrane protease YdiL (CAAX protease family)
MSDLPLAALLAGALLLLLAVTGRLRFVSEELATPTTRGAGLFLLWLVLTACVFMPTVSPGAAAEVDPDTLWFPSIFVGQILLSGFLLAWWWLAQPVSAARFLFFEEASLDDISMGVRVGAFGWLCAITASAATMFALLAFGREPLDPSGIGAEPLEVPELLLWLVDLSLWRKLIVVAVAMTVEEAFYRAFLQTRVGWVLSSVLFALSHAGYGLPTLMASVFAVSLAIGWAFRRRRSLLPCIVAHGVFDAVQLLVIMPIAVKHLPGA